MEGTSMESFVDWPFNLFFNKLHVFANLNFYTPLCACNSYHFNKCIQQGRLYSRFWLDLTDSDVMWNTSDTGWAKSAWSSVFSPWIQGACVFAHYLPRFEPTSILQVRQTRGGSWLEMC